MAKKTKITIKSLLRGKKLKVTKPDELIPFGIIGGRVTRVFHRTMDQGTVPYFRGMFWSKDLITGEVTHGEVCVLSAGPSFELMERGPGVEFAFRLSLGAANMFLYEPIISPRIDNVVLRLSQEVNGLLELESAMIHQQTLASTITKEGENNDTSSGVTAGAAGGVGVVGAGAGGISADTQTGESLGTKDGENKTDSNAGGGTAEIQSAGSGSDGAGVGASETAPKTTGSADTLTNEKGIKRGKK